MVFVVIFVTVLTYQPENPDVLNHPNEDTSPPKDTVPEKLLDTLSLRSTHNV
jgi:hypothetical protein